MGVYRSCLPRRSGGHQGCSPPNIHPPRPARRGGSALAPLLTKPALSAADSHGKTHAVMRAAADTGICRCCAVRAWRTASRGAAPLRRWHPRGAAGCGLRRGRGRRGAAGAASSRGIARWDQAGPARMLREDAEFAPSAGGSERRGAKRQLLAPAAAARRRRHCGVQDGGGRGARAAAPPRRRSRAGAAGRGGGGTRAAGSTSPRRGARARPAQGPADGRPPRAGPPQPRKSPNPVLPRTIQN